MIQCRYDALNRRTSKTFAAPWTADTVAYGYDLAGRPTSALYRNQAGAPGVAWTYDAAGRRTGEATNGQTLSFAYDADSNPASLTWPDAASVTFAYDPADRFSSVSNSAFSVAAGYDTLSRVNALTRPSSTSTIGYDKADRLASLAHAFAPTTGNETWTQIYTAGGQLSQATSSNGAWDWQAASQGAIATSVNGLNQNATVGAASWTYDANGNLTSDGVRTFSYDPENRLLTESGPTTMTLAYDPTGRLEQSVINGATTGFLYDGDALMAELSSSGSVLRRYVHGPEVDNPLAWFEGAAVTSTNASYLIADRQGSIAGVANSSGTLAANYTYDAYGAPSAWGTIGTAPRFRYTGQIAIPEAQLYYYKARVYDPAPGKFLQTDPVGDKDNLNLYSYAGDDPTNGVDPTGGLSYLVSRPVWIFGSHDFIASNAKFLGDPRVTLHDWGPVGREQDRVGAEGPGTDTRRDDVSAWGLGNAMGVERYAPIAAPDNVVDFFAQGVNYHGQKYDFTDAIVGSNSNVAPTAVAMAATNAVRTALGQSSINSGQLALPSDSNIAPGRQDTAKVDFAPLVGKTIQFKLDFGTKTGSLIPIIKTFTCKVTSQSGSVSC